MSPVNPFWVDPVPFSRPGVTEEDVAAVVRVLRSGWLTSGEEVERFEAEFGAFVGAPAVAVSSCTAALHLALAGLDPEVKYGEVIVPTLTFTATAAAVLMAGAVPVLVDVDPAWLTLTAAQAAPHVTNLTRALLPVHYGGTPSGFQSLLDFAQVRRLRVVDDAAHALPATLASGAQVGAAGHATAFSFYPTKPITTGEGGMVTLRSRAAAARARGLALHGIDRDAYQRSRQAATQYDVREHGWKYNLPDVLAALGRSQLARAPERWQSRTALAARYTAALAAAGLEEYVRAPEGEAGTQSSWHLYAVRFYLDRLRPGWTRDRIAAQLAAAGVQTSMHYRPLHQHTYWRAWVQPGQTFPVADAAADALLSLPIWAGMPEAAVDQVVERLGAILVKEAAA